VSAEALRALVDAYAHHVDRREFDTVAALFTDDGVLLAQGSELRGRAAIATALEAGLSRYDVTTHFLGQQTVTIDGDDATGETYCRADQRGNDLHRTLAIRYLDRYVRTADTWLIAERDVHVDWAEDHDIQPRP
jgi:uncharacterized protein (TIGR02246 family)